MYFLLFFSVIRITQWWSLELGLGASCCWVVRPLFLGEFGNTIYSYAIFERLSLFCTHTHERRASLRLCSCINCASCDICDIYDISLHTIYLYIISKVFGQVKIHLTCSNLSKVPSFSFGIKYYTALQTLHYTAQHGLLEFFAFQAAARASSVERFSSVYNKFKCEF